MKREARVVLALAALVLALFWPALENDFVFDDRAYMLVEKRVTEGLSWESLRWALGTAGLGLYAPVTRLSTMLDFELYGKSPRGHHLTNLLLHAANAGLLFLALAGLTGALWRSAAVAGLFAAHPVNVETVAWVAARGDLLAALFGFVALLAWRWNLRRPGWARGLPAAGAFLLGMLSKGSVMTLPVALLLLDYWPLGRPGIPGSPAPAQGSGRGPSRARAVAGLFAEKGPLFLVTAVLVGAALLLMQSARMAVLEQRYPLPVRVATSILSCATYPLKALWPSRLAVFYPNRWETYAAWEPLAAALLLVAVTAGVVAAARRIPALAVGWFWYLVLLLPVTGLYQAREYSIADRYGYLPLIGLFLAVVWGLAELGERLRRPRAAAAVVCLLIVACLPASRLQLRHWKNDFTLFTRALAVTEGNFMAHYWLGWIAAWDGRRADAVAHFRETVRLEPGMEKAHYDLGVLLALEEKIEEAEQHYRRALALNPRHSEAHANLGELLLRRGRISEAAVEVRAALRLAPGDELAHYNLGLILERTGERAAAIEEYRAALRLRPDFELARNALAALLRTAGSAR